MSPARPRKRGVRERSAVYGANIVHYWDTSALMPLLVRERWSDRVNSLYRANPRMVTWWATRVEVHSGLERLCREGKRYDVAGAEARLRALVSVWHELLPSEAVRVMAERLLAGHSLRAADALQLAAAMIASQGDPTTLPFVTLDRQLADAAARMGFPIVLSHR